MPPGLQGWVNYAWEAFQVELNSCPLSHVLFASYDQFQALSLGNFINKSAECKLSVLKIWARESHGEKIKVFIKKESFIVNSQRYKCTNFYFYHLYVLLHLTSSHSCFSSNNDCHVFCVEK